jgi:hypothetical protein
MFTYSHCRQLDPSDFKLLVVAAKLDKENTTVYDVPCPPQTIYKRDHIATSEIFTDSRAPASTVTLLI